MHRITTFNLLFLLIFLTACGTLPPALQSPSGFFRGDPAATLCMEKFTRLDKYTLMHSLTDVQARQIPGFPFLRSNRFLASFSGEDLDESESAFWVEQLAQLDYEGRRAEMGAMQLQELQHILQSQEGRDLLEISVNECREILLANLLADDNAVRSLKQSVTVPDNYSDISRVIGLYPVTSLPVMWGIHQLHKRTRARLETGFTKTEEKSVQSYIPPAGTLLTQSDIKSLLETSYNNPLGIPIIDDEHLLSLFRFFAPVFRIQTRTDADYPGYPVWRNENTIDIDTGIPVVFTHLSYTRFYGRILAQLNYTIWFPERPLEGKLDLLGGHIDGVTWRVTLDTEGQPLIFDVIHNCGCYHMVFTPPRVQKNERNTFWQEPMLIFELPESGYAIERAILSFDSGRHYLTGILFTGSPPLSGIKYSLVAYDRLRYLPYTGKVTRSMFAENGIVPGTERGERWLLWPMGVPEPGAMRQWGNHAIAFIGKRHFDDPWLWEQNFSAPIN